MKDFFDTQFMSEPLYRWFAFIVVIGLFMAVWGRVLEYMRGAVT